jgi:F-type H+-transporting ATPase subunit epsilon
VADPLEGHDKAPSIGDKLFAVTIVTPQGKFAEYNVRHLRAPGTEGDFGVLRGHIPFMTALRIGTIVLESAEGRLIWATSGGFAEVLREKVTILAETAERADNIDVERAESARKRAMERLAQQASGGIDVERASVALARAINRLKIASPNEAVGH